MYESVCSSLVSFIIVGLSFFILLIFASSGNNDCDRFLAAGIVAVFLVFVFIAFGQSNQATDHDQYVIAEAFYRYRDKGETRYEFKVWPYPSEANKMNIIGIALSKYRFVIDHIHVSDFLNGGYTVSIIASNEQPFLRDESRVVRAGVQ